MFALSSFVWDLFRHTPFISSHSHRAASLLGDLQHINFSPTRSDPIHRVHIRYRYIKVSSCILEEALTDTHLQLALHVVTVEHVVLFAHQSRP